MSFGLVGSITSRITELEHNITCIDTGYMRPQLAACYLIEQEGSAGIIETGTATALETILAVLEYKNIALENVHYVMPTHVHLDHAGGAGHLLQALPNARLVIHPRGARHMLDPSRLMAGARAVYGEAVMQRLYGELIPVAEERMLIAEDEFVIDLGGRRLLFLDTPGHARHHYSIYDERSYGFFTGDTFGIAYRELRSAQGRLLMPTTSPVQFDPNAWEQSLDRYLSYKPDRMYLTHYGMVEGVEALAGELRQGIAHYVRIAQQYADAEQRYELIKTAITELTMAKLKAINCPLPVPACRGMLEMDIDLNVQGLEVWLEQQKAA